MKLYSIYDAKVKAYNDPFCSTTDLSAERSFVSSLLDPNAPASVRLHKADYSLYCVGDFDADTSLITAQIPPALIIAGNSINTEY